jgi:flagellar hook protein FlgE
MSISAALNTAVSALRAQSAALSTISNNLANSSTVGYKASSTSFESMLSGSSTSSSGGVTSSVQNANGAQGTVVSSSVSTNLAINGSGFFTVSGQTSGGALNYTRNGEFEVDSDGYLASDGNYLMGWATDDDGKVIGSTSSSNLSAINVSDITSSVSATENMTVSGNLPAEAETGDSFSTTTEIYDSLGTPSTLTLNWSKTAENTWDVSFTSDDSSASVTSGAISVTFNTDGTLASPETATLAISGWSSGGADSAITLDFGTAGKTDGVAQYDSGEDTATMDLSISQDGLEYGNLSGISISNDGSVVASFDNGEDRVIYKIALATFNNPNGLTNTSGSLYASSLDSGAASYHVAGTAGVGTIEGSALESSTTDTSAEFSNMMQAQQAYSAASQVMSTANSMFETLMSAVR